MDCGHDFQITQPFFPWCHRLLVLDHSLRHMIHFGGEVVYNRQVTLLDRLAPFNP
jgi:hypothetical protein